MGQRHVAGSDRIGSILLVALVVAAGMFVAYLNGFFKDDQPYSLCPDNRSSTELVTDSRVMEEGADYTGRGPHHLIVDGPSFFAEESLPEGWVVPRESSHAYRTDHIQLVVCEYVYAIGAEGDLQTCSYTPIDGGPTSTFTTQSAKYDYKVYEATTGKLRAAFTLEGVTHPCAKVRTVPGGSALNTESPASPDYKELERELEPLVF